MARRENELFIGTEHLTLEGRAIKHPALIKHYANVNANKTTDERMQLIGLDIETNHETAELKLLGFYNGSYTYYTDNFLNVLFGWLRHAQRDDKKLAYWNRLDPFILFKQFLLQVDKTTAYNALKRFGKVSGEWDKKAASWTVQPVISIELGDYIVGIKQAIRSSVQFFYIRKGDEKLRTVWAYDIAQLYEGGLEKEALARFDYYSKVDKSAHLVDWDRFNRDTHYRNNIVLKSNELDARACHDLGIAILDDFKKAFGYYPRTLISTGGLARTATVATLRNQLDDGCLSEEQLKKAVAKEVKSIGFMHYYDKWANKYGGEFLKDFYALLTESYSGGYIETIRYGYAKSGWYADIASAYPGVIKDLYDLRGAKLSTGKGNPPRAKHGYTFIRGTLNVPDNVNFNPVTIKHFINKDTNIRAVGQYRASYELHERDLLEKQGCTFSDETWYMVETKGEKSALANVCMSFIDLRRELQAQKDSAQYMTKISANSLYGILFEAVDTYEDITITKEVEREDYKYYKQLFEPYFKNLNILPYKNDICYVFGEDKWLSIYNKWHSNEGYALDVAIEEIKGKGFSHDSNHPIDWFISMHELMTSDKVELKDVEDVARVGYRAGEFFNPLYASIITSRTRILMAEAALAIEKAGGKVILMMTDSITWEGTKDMMPADLVRDVKTLGYFETPEEVTDIICLGSGRYGFTTKNGYVTSKKRGLNASNIHDADGVVLDTFNWRDAVDIMKKTKKDVIDINVRMLISNGVIVHNSNYDIKDLGLVAHEKRTVDAIVGKSKRLYDESIKNPMLLATSLVDTEPLKLMSGMMGHKHICDQTLPELREKLMTKKVITAKDKRKKNVNKSVKRYYNDNKDALKAQYKKNYAKLKALGYDSYEATKLSKWSTKRLEKEIFNRSVLPDVL